MDVKAKAARARAALQDEILQLAYKETLDRINRQLLAAKTPEEREQKWQEYHGLKRGWNTLKKWPGEAEHEERTHG